MSDNAKKWLKGLAAGVLSSIASGIVLVVKDPHQYDDWANLGSTVAILGVWGAAMYLAKSPIWD